MFELIALKFIRFVFKSLSITSKIALDCVDQIALDIKIGS